MSSLLTSLLLLLTFSPAIAEEYCNEEDKKTLLTIKKQLNIPYTNISWTTDYPCCDWPSVECDDNDRVIELFLDELEDTLIIPPAITDLPYLTSLVFCKNPGLVGPIPSFIGEMKGLTFLHLDRNNLTGPVPDFLSQLTKLVYLNLGFNRLSGFIPPFLGSLPALRYIRIDGNQLTGEIPASLGTSPSTHLLLGHNNLVGTIPKSFASNNYHKIDLSRNNLTGDALVLLGISRPLQRLNLSGNAFEFDMLKVEFPVNMTVLDINHNKIYGSLPPELGKVSWKSLNVSYNRLCGPIPVGKYLRSRSIVKYDFLHNKCLCEGPLPPCK